MLTITTKKLAISIEKKIISKSLSHQSDTLKLCAYI
jgi:hypothetical protein